MRPSWSITLTTLFFLFLAHIVMSNVINRQSRRLFDSNGEFLDKKMVFRAMKCIRGEKCSFLSKHSKFLRGAGPMLLICGRCPPEFECDAKGEADARRLLVQTSVQFPRVFQYTYHSVKRKFPQHFHCPHN